jgi:hypothetical protein
MSGRTLERWTPAFTIVARHAFFGDAPCPSVAFEPVEETRARLANLGLLCRDGPGTLTAFRSDRAGSDAAADLTFRLVTTDAAFANYTRLDGADARSTLWFDSATAAAADTGIERRLHTGATVSATDRIALDAPSLLGATTTRDFAAPPLGFVRLRTAPADSSATTWIIAFDARTTLWKYYVLGASEAVPTIRDADGEIEFEPAAPTVLPGNRRAVVLRSKVPIPLRDRPTQRFQLRVATPAGERVLVKRLALASPNRLGKDTVDGREVTVSEIYVNL